MTDAAKPATLRAAPLVAGVALLVLYVRVGIAFGFQASYGPPLPPTTETLPTPFAFVSPGEFRMWIANLVFAVPGALLVAWGLAPRLAPALRRWVARIDAATPRTWRIWGAVLFAVLFFYALAGHYLVLLGQPLTDDENAVTFGARILASGHVMVPQLQPPGAWVDLFTYQRDGMVTAMDFPGVLGFAALAIVTKLGPALYALATATTGVATAYAAGRWFGPRARVVAAALWLASPMIGALSITSHGHVPSRMFVALALAFASRLDTDAGTPRRDAILLGVMAGFGFLCRPFETAVLLAPLAVYLGWKQPRRLGWMFGALVPAVIVFALYNSATTGVWYLQARFAPGVTAATPSLAHTMGERVGFHLGWNALLLAVFFLGIPAIAALAAGLSRKLPITLVLGCSVLAVLLVSLVHDNVGIHSVGPIHLSETTVPLVLLATAGIVRGFAWLGDRGVARAAPAVLLAGYLALGCGLFGLANLASLRMQAGTLAVPGDTLAEAGVHHAIVMARPYIVLLQTAKGFAPWGSWVLQYPQPSPDLDDDILWAQPNADPRKLHALYPDRDIYKLVYAAEPPILRLEKFAPPPPK